MRAGGAGGGVDRVEIQFDGPAPAVDRGGVARDIAQSLAAGFQQHRHFAFGQVRGELGGQVDGDLVVVQVAPDRGGPAGGVPGVSGGDGEPAEPVRKAGSAARFQNRQAEPSGPLAERGFG